MATLARCAALFAGVVLIACWAVPAGAMDTVVSTTLGPVRGVVSDEYAYYLGIPFAADTGEENRFMPPQPRASWSDTFDATYWGPGCLTTSRNPDTPKVTSEDCLNVNVFSPAAATSSSSLPVMVFFFGGGFVEGSNQGPWFMYNSSNIVSKKDVVVASCNYRIGAFGFLVTDGVNGNQGILDQRKCLEWVRDNIASFGGDPSQVTIWGESAGAMSVGIHLVSPGSAGLFNRIVMESNPAGYRYRSLSDAKVYGDATCSDLGCKPLLGSCNVTCLQHQAATAVANTYHQVTTSDYLDMARANWDHWLEIALGCAPSVDGDVLPMTVQQALDTGAFDKNVDVLVGTNNNEGTTFVYWFLTEPMSKLKYDALMLAVFGDSVAEKIKTFYSSITSTDYREQLSQMVTDMWFRCGSEVFATSITQAGGNGYVYKFSYPNFSAWPLFELYHVPSQCKDKTCHMVELPFVFDTTRVYNPDWSMTPEEISLANTIVDYWTNFGISGNPNTGGSEPGFEWPLWSPSGRENVNLGRSLGTESSASLCAFWDSIGYDW